MKNNANPVNRVENADAICQKILEESGSQSSDILQRTQEEASRILNESKAESEKKKEEILKQLDSDLVKIKERVFSILNIEKKKILLKGKTEFIEEVLKAVKDKAEEFRSGKEYKNFLKNAVLEGAGIVDREEIDVFYSQKDEKIFSSDFTAETQKACIDKYNKNFFLQFKKINSSDIGVVVQSGDGNVIFNNTFLGRFKRKYDEIYMELLKEA